MDASAGSLPGRPRRVLIPAALAALSTLWAADAAAYQRTQTCNSYGTYACDPGEKPKPIAWPVRCLEYRINRRGSDDFSDDGLSPQLREYVRRSFRTWQQVDCSDLQLVEGELTDNSKARYRQSKGWSGNMNLVVWRDETWPHMRGHSFALTSVTYNSESGRIVDADIEVNSAESTFAHFAEPRVGETSKVDIVNALTHEVGHFVGLDHTPVEAATMYVSARPGEIEKRSLHRDDRKGLCSVYPVGDRRERCDQPSDFVPPGANKGRGSGGCCGAGTASRTSGAPLVWIVLTLTGTLVGTRLQRRLHRRS